jgi:zinc transport system substrate-binding protein
MRNIVLLITAFALLTACGTQEQKVHNVITVSILPQETFVRKIVGNDFKVNVLVPPGASPEAHSLLPSQLKDIANSDIWLRIGYIGFEQSWKDKIAQANSKMKVVNTAEGLDLIAEQTEQHGDHVHVDGIDPHIWLSPSMVKQMAKKITEEVSKLKPERAAFYEANYKKFAEECDSLDVELGAKLEPYRGRKFIVFHPSLSYFAREFSLDQHALESGGKEPTPQHMKEIVDLANRENIRVIYIQSEFDKENARVFAEEINGKVLQVSPLNPDWANNLRSMADLLIQNF